MVKLKFSLIGLLLLAVVCPAIFADGTQQKILKFQQLPLDGVSIDGTDYPFFGHDELSTAYSWYEGDPDTGLIFAGYRGCYMADDFADRHDTPVVSIKWWGSYLGNEIFQKVTSFLVAFEEDIPAVGQPGTADYRPSRPGKVLSTEIVRIAPAGSALGVGQYNEQIVSDGGAPCFEQLYEYNAVLAKPFPQKPDTVYWIKIVALVDLEPDYTQAFMSCLQDAAGNQMSLCDYLHQNPVNPDMQCPRVTRWGWHNRDYRINNPEASVAPAVSPGEKNQRFMFDTAGFVTDVWHFQDDCVSGRLKITGDTTNPDCTDCLKVTQIDFNDMNYVYDKLCFDPTVNHGVDGPIGINRFSEDLAFELYTDPSPDPDCNGNGINDAIDIANGTSNDCNGNGIPDECENDCNCNGVDDAIDIATGTSKDCNGNGIPDECEDDCNGNGVPDDCDIATGTSKDCNGNGIPDECETDCNNNDIPDDCDIAAGTSLDANNNGIPDECEPPCTNPSTWICTGGTFDDFGTADGPENTNPSSYLIANPGYCYNGGLTLYDFLPSNTCFIETLGNGCWPASSPVVAATLEIRLKAGSYIPQTDSIILKQNATVLWSLSLNNLINWKTSGADTVWNAGEAAETFLLDLSALPTTAGPTADILSDLTAGFVDVIVADDTGVDYMVLKVTTCPCKYQGQVEYVAGIADAYAMPTETTFQGAELALYGGPSKNFDAPQVNRPVKHTFANLPNNIVSGVLTVRLKAGASGASCNDTIGLQAKNTGTPGLLWGRRIGTAGTSTWCSGPAGLYAGPWTTGTDTTLTLNLSSLPNTTGGPTNLMTQINLDKRLDVYVQDDTTVDYMKLRLNICCRKKKVVLVGDLDYDDHVNLKDLVIIARDWMKSSRPAQEIDPKDPPCRDCP